jgi:hypothetical protein
MVSIDAVLPDTVQIELVAEAKPTASPELAVADRVTFAPALELGITGKVIVCGARCTTTTCVTGVAAA